MPTAETTSYWTERRLTIWSGLTPMQRDYDRLLGVYPLGQGAFETEGAADAVIERDGQRDHECTCFINPPCTHCVECTQCPTDS